MKLKNIIKSAMIGAMLVSGTYTLLVPVDAKAATNNNYELSEKAKSELNENVKVESTIKKVEEEHPIVEGATVKKYTYVSGSDYVKNKKYYKVYKLYWTSTNKVSYVGIAMHTASSYEQVMYSTSGNKVDSRAKLTSKQKKIITTLKNNKTYSKQFRYVAVYDTNAKWTRLYIVPRDNKKVIDDLYNGSCYSIDSKGGFSLGRTSKNSPLRTKVKIAYALNVLPHIGTEKAWYNAFTGGDGVFRGYFTNVYDGEFFAFKSKHAR
ncbi:hypothetical protein [Rummeliibacillus suwonensis]|uniref:hypothetical protein n=1 Tax=Rummeliibacillus suwonensis TaxID=1306154 RepID=UPI0028A0FEE5|nr:hypothetical protein [Rummeliibacillus suwonensis]